MIECKEARLTKNEDETYGVMFKGCPGNINGETCTYTIEYPRAEVIISPLECNQYLLGSGRKPHEPYGEQSIRIELPEN